MKQPPLPEPVPRTLQQLNGYHLKLVEAPDAKELTLRFLVDSYAAGGSPRVRIDSYDAELDFWEPWHCLTVNLVDQPKLASGVFFVKAHDYQDILDRLLETGLFVDRGVWIEAGYVTHYARIWSLVANSPS